MKHYTVTLTFEVNVEGANTVEVIERITEWVADLVELPHNLEITDIREDK